MTEAKISSSPPPTTPQVIPDLLQRAGRLRDEAGWEPLWPGVRIRRLYQSGDAGPAAALLCYEPEASIPAHEHLGFEHVLILDGAQSDEFGCYPAGTLVVNRPRSVHRVASASGCVVLVIWGLGVRFLDPSSAPEVRGNERGS